MESISAKDQEIFIETGNLLVKQDFIQAQFDFFEKTKDTFEDCDENKLEHTTIYNDYTMILDEVIEAKLVEKFSQEEIKAFYESFVANHKEYEKINEQTVESLFEFKEFSLFKKKMLAYKRGMDDGTLKKETTEDTDSLPLQ